MANIIKTDKKVQFLHFTGTQKQWESQIINNSNLDSGYIVYGYIYDVEDKSTRSLVSKLVYAGKDSNGLQYIYNSGEGNSSSIVVENYEEAESYINGGKAKEGDIISTKDDQTTYIVLENPEGILELVSLNKRCKWIYAADSSISGNWHIADDVITNPIGLIKSGTTLGEFVDHTDGEFSRMIEMMLFKNEKPYVKLTVLPDSETEDPYSQIAINVLTENADETIIKVYKGTEEIKSYSDVKDGKLLINELEHSTTYRIYAESRNQYYEDPATDSVTSDTEKRPEAKVLKLESSDIDHNSVVLTVNSSNASTATLINKTTGNPIEIDFLNKEASIIVSGLNAGKSYIFVANASNGFYETSDSKSLTIQTIAFTEPTVIVNQTNEQTTGSNSLHVSTIDVNVTKEGDYTIIPSNTYILKDGNTVIAEGDLDTIKAANVSYGKTYTLTTSYDASLNLPYVEGDASLYTKEISSSVYVKVPDTASVNISKVNGEDYTEPVEISTDSFTVTIDSSARLYSGTVNVYVKNGDTKTEVSTYNITNKNTSDIKISGLSASDNNQQVIVELSDEYGTKTTTIEFKYAVELLYLISAIEDTASETINFTSIEGSEESEKFTSNTISSLYKSVQNAVDFFKIANDSKWPNVDYASEDDKAWYPEGVLCENDTRFFIRNKAEEFSNIKELTTTTVIDNNTYYGYYTSATYPSCSIFCLIPVNYELEMWSDNSGVPYSKIQYSKDDNTLMYNGAEYNVYYATKDGTAWDNYPSGKLTWLLIKSK